MSQAKWFIPVNSNNFKKERFYEHTYLSVQHVRNVETTLHTYFMKVSGRLQVPLALTCGGRSPEVCD
jgi:hypothetical protein